MNKWKFKNGFTAVECLTFPLAFKAMYYEVQNKLKEGKSFGEIIKGISIVSPIKDIHGEFRKYNYTEANEMAKNAGLFNADGTLNKKSFKLN
jgi:hypothetical protein